MTSLERAGTQHERDTLRSTSGARRRAHPPGLRVGGAKPRGLLELLLLARGRTVSKEQLAEALWGANPPRNVAGTLEHYVCVLRRKLFVDQVQARRVLVTEPGAYRFDTSRPRPRPRRVRPPAAAGRARRRRPSPPPAGGRGRARLVSSCSTTRRTPRGRSASATCYRGRVARAHLWLARRLRHHGQPRRRRAPRAKSPRGSPRTPRKRSAR